MFIHFFLVYEAPFKQLIIFTFYYYEKHSITMKTFYYSENIAIFYYSLRPG